MTVKECYDAMGGDYEGMLDRMKNDDKIKRFLGMFLRDDNYQLLCTSLENKNVRDAFRAAHTLKGVSMNLSLTRFYQSVEEITECLRGREEYGDDILPYLDKVKENYKTTVDNITRLQSEG